MEQCCDICGNIGFADAIITCTKCKINTEHMYCMRILLEKDLGDWICEACESGYKPQKDSKLLNESRKGCTNWEKKVDTGKTKYISAKEAIGLSSGAQKSLPSSKHKLDSGPSRQLKTQRLGNVDISEGQHKHSNKSTPPIKEQLLKEHPTKGKLPQTKPASVRKEPPYASAFSPNAIPVTISAPINERMLKEHPAKSKPSQTKAKCAMKELSCAFAPSPNGLPVTISAPISEQVLKEHPAEGNLPQTNAENVMKEPSSAPAPSPHAPPVIISGPIREQVLKKHPAEGNLPQTNAESVMKEPSSAPAPSPHAPPVIISAPIREQVLKKHPAEGNLPQTNAESVMKEPSSAPAPSPHAPPVIISGGNGLAHVEPGTSNDENVNGNVFPDALWKGSFCVQDDLINGELNLQAHPPYQVSKKAYEFSKTMPKVLHFELVPCKELQIHFFKEYSPERRDIGLYFFSVHKERKYFSLMEYISLKNCALRKQFDDVELLVFSSQLLPEDCQRFEGTYFLWGVFHCLKRDRTAHLNNMGLSLTVQPSHNANYGHNEGDNGEEVDMDIDMIGGVDVGKIDVRVQREPFQEEHIISGSVTPVSVSRDTGSVTRVPSINVKMEPYTNVPPGFEEIYRLRVQNSLSPMTNSEEKKKKVGPWKN